MAKLEVRDLMTEEVLSVQASDSLAAAYDLMEGKHIRHVPVLDSAGEVVGLISNRDMLKSFLSAEMSELPVSAQRELLARIRVEEVMTREPETVEADLGIGEAAAIMLENKWSSLPVVEGSRLIGILTEADFVKHVADNRE